MHTYIHIYIYIYIYIYILMNTDPRGQGVPFRCARTAVASFSLRINPLHNVFRFFYLYIHIYIFPYYRGYIPIRGARAFPSHVRGLPPPLHSRPCGAIYIYIFICFCIYTYIHTHIYKYIPVLAYRSAGPWLPPRMCANNRRLLFTHCHAECRLRVALLGVSSHPIDA